MNHKQRYIETLTFGNPDKIPLIPGYGRESTLERWHKEGLPLNTDPLDYICGELGISIGKVEYLADFSVNSRMIPTFEEKVLSHENGHYIVQDWMGAITEISDKYDYTYIRNAIDFVTRKWHKFPVETSEDFQKMKTRFDPMEPSRLSGDPEILGDILKDREYPISVAVNGPFWQLREWLGMENLCIAFIERPEFVEEMIDFWCDFVVKLLERFLPYVQIDSLNINEDMAYKAKSMISPAMTRKFLQPVYEKWISVTRKYNVPIVDMDSDGFIEELIPIWIDSGINVCDPIEVAAYNDIVKFRKIFGKNMAFTGGIDKRAIAKGGIEMYNEVNRVVPPLLKDGGFIPSCDHGVPPDISLHNFMEYTKLLAKLTGWL